MNLNRRIKQSPFYVIVRFELREGGPEMPGPLIKEFFSKEVSTFAGFISAKIHMNEEGTVLINYATWQSAEKFQKFIEFASVSEMSGKIQAFNPYTDRVFEIIDETS